MARAKQRECFPDPDEIVQQIVNAERADVRRRWHVIYLASQLGQDKLRFSKKTIARKVGYKSVQHVTRVLAVFQERGAVGVEGKRPGGGPKPKLDEGHLKQLVEVLKRIDIPTWRDVHTYTDKALPDGVSNATARRLFKRFGTGELERSLEPLEPTVQEEQTTPKKADTPSKSGGKVPENVEREKQQSPPQRGLFDTPPDDET